VCRPLRHLIAYVVEAGSFAPNLHSNGFVAYKGGHLCTACESVIEDVARGAAHHHRRGGLRNLRRQERAEVRASLPAVSIRRVHAEPASESVPARASEEVAWLALWDDGTVIYYPSARALLRAVRQRDQRDATRAERRGHGALFATVITWHDTPPGFVPPQDCMRSKAR
jgi:hypothetical protein